MKLFVKNLTHVDLSYFCRDRGLLGESWHTDITLTGKLNDESMICDFSIVKKRIKQWLDEHIDHTLALPVSHPDSILDHHNDGRLIYSFRHQDGSQFECTAPSEAFCQLPLPHITPEDTARWVEQQNHRPATCRT